MHLSPWVHTAPDSGRPDLSSSLEWKNHTPSPGCLIQVNLDTHSASLLHGLSMPASSVALIRPECVSYEDFGGRSAFSLITHFHPHSSAGDAKQVSVIPRWGQGGLGEGQLALSHVVSPGQDELQHSACTCSSLICLSSYLIQMSIGIYILTKFGILRAMVFPEVTYGCESWTIKKAECWRIDAFELWCWRRLLRVPWTLPRVSPIRKLP